jgi:hypothetical protein
MGNASSSYCIVLPADAPESIVGRHVVFASDCLREGAVSASSSIEEEYVGCCELQFIMTFMWITTALNFVD